MLSAGRVAAAGGHRRRQAAIHQLVQVFADTQNGNTGYYVPVQGTALDNWKLKALLGGGTEITAGAYPSSVTTDILRLTIIARKLL